MISFPKKIYSWASRKANSKFAGIWLTLVFFLELVFFIPMDAVLIVFCLENQSKKYMYAFIATISSVLSGISGYLLGYAAWEFLKPYILDHLISSNCFENLVYHYQIHQNMAVFLGSLLPVPFKAVTLSAGVCELAFIPYLTMIFLGRFVRFFSIAKIVDKWGPQIKRFIDDHFHRFLVAIGAKIAFAMTFFWALS